MSYITTKILKTPPTVMIKSNYFMHKINTQTFTLKYWCFQWLKGHAIHVLIFYYLFIAAKEIHGYYCPIF